MKLEILDAKRNFLGVQDITGTKWKRIHDGGYANVDAIDVPIVCDGEPARTRYISKTGDKVAEGKCTSFFDKLKCGDVQRFSQGNMIVSNIDYDDFVDFIILK